MVAEVVAGLAAAALAEELLPQQPPPMLAQTPSVPPTSRMVQTQVVQFVKLAKSIAVVPLMAARWF